MFVVGGVLVLLVLFLLWVLVVVEGGGSLGVGWWGVVAHNSF